MTILVIAEHNNHSLKADTAKAVAAAQRLGGDIHVAVIGYQVQSVVSAAAGLAGVQKVLVLDNPVYQYQLAENVGDVVAELGKTYSHIIAAATAHGKNFMPRVAALLDVPQISDVIAIENASTFVRPIYAGNAIATVSSAATIHVLTVRSSAFDAVANTGNASIENLALVVGSEQSAFVSEELTQSARPDLTAARVVISGGRGMQNGENFKLLEGIADKLNAAIGASRAAVDAGFVPNDMQVGQTGKIVAPELYIAVGISGAIQHLAGMKDSKVIVAINKDAEAPIFQVADYGLVADLFTVLPELEAALS
jgi:electron transfer flavoprotein alpha subunit